MKNYFLVLFLITTSTCFTQKNSLQKMNVHGKVASIKETTYNASDSLNPLITITMKFDSKGLLISENIDYGDSSLNEYQTYLYDKKGREKDVQIKNGYGKLIESRHYKYSQDLRKIFGQTHYGKGNFIKNSYVTLDSEGNVISALFYYTNGNILGETHSGNAKDGRIQSKFYSLESNGAAIHKMNKSKLKKIEIESLKLNSEVMVFYDTFRNSIKIAEIDYLKGVHLIKEINYTYLYNTDFNWIKRTE